MPLKNPDEETQEETLDFGFRRVPRGEKQKLVDDVFHKVASRYDLMNDLMSLGVHRQWKNILVSKAAAVRRGPIQHLDMAGGTGDVAFRMAKRGEVFSVVADMNGEMLRVCRERLAKLRGNPAIETVQANAESLPFPDASFDVYTIAFGIRNVPLMERALAEARRVLKKGGRFLCLEFSHVDSSILARLYDQYSFRIIPKMGQKIAGDAESYRYLAESIRKFPDAEPFADRIRAAGFEQVRFDKLTGGVAALHCGWNL